MPKCCTYGYAASFDQDCTWMRVEIAGLGASCYVGYRSCFYRSIPVGKDVVSSKNHIRLTFTEIEKPLIPMHFKAMHPIQHNSSYPRDGK